MSILIKNGRVIDPANNQDSKKDILIEKNKVKAVASSITQNAQQIIDAEGKIVMPGLCDMHVHLREPGREDKETIKSATEAHPGALVLAHPECNPEVLNISDVITSTGGMIKYVKASDKKSFIIATESGMFYKLKKDNPDKEFFIPTEQLICPSMKLTTLGWVLHSLELLKYEVKVPEDVAKKAKKALNRMLEVSGEPSGSAISGV